nr:hypothetical protein [Mycoplasmopsis bovis]
MLRGGTVPTKYIDKNGKEISDDSWDLSNIDATVINKNWLSRITKELLESYHYQKILNKFQANYLQ